MERWFQGLVVREGVGRVSDLDDVEMTWPKSEKIGYIEFRENRKWTHYGTLDCDLLIEGHCEKRRI